MVSQMGLISRSYGLVVKSLLHCTLYIVAFWFPWERWWFKPHQDQAISDIWEIGCSGTHTTMVWSITNESLWFINHMCRCIRCSIQSYTLPYKMSESQYQLPVQGLMISQMGLISRLYGLVVKSLRSWRHSESPVRGGGSTPTRSRQIRTFEKSAVVGLEPPWFDSLRMNHYDSSTICADA